MARRVPENALRMVVAGLLFAVGIMEIHDAALGSAYSLTGAGRAFDGWHYLAISLCGLVIGIESGLTVSGRRCLPSADDGIGLRNRPARRPRALRSS